MSRRQWLASAMTAVVLALGVAACGNTHSPTSPDAPTTPPPGPTLTTVTVNGTAPEIGGTEQFAATATMSDATTHNVSGEAMWKTSDDMVAQVSPKGVVAAVSAGDVDITATFQNVSGTMHVSIK